MGEMWEKGLGTTRDVVEAFKWYALACGRSTAPFRRFYRKLSPEQRGEGYYRIARDYKLKDASRQRIERCEWLILAAESGSHVARQELRRSKRSLRRNELNDVYYELGWMCERGFAVIQNLKKAACWYGLAARRGYDAAQHQMGRLYSNGIGVPKNLSKSVSWYSKAAQSGYHNAQFDLAILFLKGYGVRRDRDEAMKWLRRAAAQCNSDAFGVLANEYFRGRNVGRDLVEACRWAFLAHSRGWEEKDRERLSQIKLELTPEEIDRARQRAFYPNAKNFPRLIGT